MNNTEFRPLTKSELPLIREMRMYSFYDWSDEKPTEEELAYFTEGEFFGIFNDNHLVSALRSYNFFQVVRGEIKKMSGIASVSTPPEYRRKGYIKTLMIKTFENMKSKEQCVSMLWPFKDSFYNSFGYVNACSEMRVKMPIHSFSHYIDLSKNIQGDWSELKVKAVDVKDIFDQFKSEIAYKHNGLILLTGISDGVWNSKCKNNLAIIIKLNGKVEAIARYTKKGFQEKGEIIVEEMYWKGIEARMQLFYFFAKHLDQVAKIQLPIPFGTNFHQWIKNTMSSFEVTIPYFPWMVRIIDVKDAINGIPVSDNGSLIVQVVDEYCKWNENIYEIKSDELRLNICENRLSNVDVKIDIRGLTSLLYGTLSIDELEFVGLIHILRAEKRDLIRRWFPTIPFYNSYYY